MKFDNLADFLAMGGHGLYVWLAYGIALVILVFNVWQPLRMTRQFFSEQSRRLRRERKLS